MYHNNISQQFNKTQNQMEALRPTKIHFVMKEFKTLSNE